MAIKRVIIKTTPVEQEKNDKKYWLSQTPEIRYQAAKIIRDRYIKLKYGSEPRLQRVHRVTKRK